MRPGELIHVTPYLTANPLRGSTRPAWPSGMAMLSPVPTSARPPPARNVHVSTATKSQPASPSLAYWGSTASSWSTLTGISIARRLPAGLPPGNERRLLLFQRAGVDGPRDDGPRT